MRGILIMGLAMALGFGVSILVDGHESVERLFTRLALALLIFATVRLVQRNWKSGHYRIK